MCLTKIEPSFNPKTGVTGPCILENTYGTLDFVWRTCKQKRAFNAVLGMVMTVLKIFMNKKQRQPLERIFEKPERSDIAWPNIESLFLALGAGIFEGRGSVGPERHKTLVLQARKSGKSLNTWVTDTPQKTAKDITQPNA